MGVVIGVIGITKLLSLADMNLKLVARSASVAIEAAVYFDDREIMLEQLEQLLPGADVAKAQLSINQKAAEDVWILPEVNRLNFFAQGLVRLLLDPASVAVTYQNEKLATLTLWPNGERILRFMLLGGIALLMSLVMTAAIILIVTHRLHNRLSKPLLELAEVSAQVRANRDFSLRVSRSHIAEIDSLRVDFNALLDELNQWQGTMESLNKHLHYHANHDGLTGVANRHFFEKTLQRALDFAKENQSSLSLLYLDGDDFKSINDTYGHAAGDEVLRVMSQRIKSALRETDLVARVGGDEFCILLNHVGQLSEINELSAKVVEAVNQPLKLSESHDIQLSVSIGYARYPEDGETIDALMHAADFAMYRIKQHENVT